MVRTHAHALAVFVFVACGKEADNTVVPSNTSPPSFGETIDAVIWISDMRDFTSLSDRIDNSEMIRLLNAFFEGLVDAVHGQGGEVLKFVGDGMLAIFPISGTQAEPAAAAAALAAARQA